MDSTLVRMPKLVHIQTARIGQALASPVRLRALNLLAQRPWPVGEIAAELGESMASASAHLRSLREACLVVHQRQGRRVMYRIAGSEAIRLLAAVNRAASALLPEMREVVREAMSDPTRMQPTDPKVLAAQVEAGEVHLVDLRPIDEYEAGRLPGARSVPLRGLDAIDLSELPSDGSVLAYGRGPWCVIARQGVMAVNERGVPARLLPLGVVEWRAAGLELEHHGAGGCSASVAEESDGH